MKQGINLRNEKFCELEKNDLKNTVCAFDDAQIKGNQTQSIYVCSDVYRICYRIECWHLMMLIAKEITRRIKLTVIKSLLAGTETFK